MKLKYFSPLLIACAFISCAQEKNSDLGIATEEQAATGAHWASFPVPIQADGKLLAQEGASEDVDAALSFWETRAKKKLFAYAGARNLWSYGRPYALSRNRAPQVNANVIYLERAGLSRAAAAHRARFLGWKNPPCRSAHAASSS